LIALGCAALVLMPELAESVAGHAQTSSRDGGLSKLWRTYPLSDRLKVPLRSSGEAPTKRTTAPSPGHLPQLGDASSALSVAPLACWSDRHRARRAARRDGRSPCTRLIGAVRIGTRLSRAVPCHGARPKLAGRAFEAAPGRASALVRPRAALRSAMVGIYSKRGEILLYAFAVVASVAAGVGVTLLLRTVDAPGLAGPRSRTARPVTRTALRARRRGNARAARLRGRCARTRRRSRARRRRRRSGVPSRRSPSASGRRRTGAPRPPTKAPA
jgi:hypothetical protein